MCSLFAQAQLVFIPDTNFRDVLISAAPGAVDVNGYLDPQHPAALALDTLLFQWPPVVGTWDPTLPLDLTGIDAFPNLLNLEVDCFHSDGFILAYYDDVLVTVPAWPSTLQKLSIRFGTYAVLPPWPNNIVELEYELPSGPAALPSFPTTLERITLKVGEDLIALPDLPSGLRHATLQAPNDNVVPQLPSGIDTLSIAGFDAAGVAAWPDALRKLTLNNIDAWTSVPAWPSDLLDVSITGAADLVSIPSWPASLVRLNIINCPSVIALPAFNIGITSLTLQGLGALAAVPMYPATVEDLLIGGLGVTTLPAWPPLVEHIRVNQIMPDLTALPDFPDHVRYITTYADFPMIAELPEWPDSLRELTMYSCSIHELPPFPEHLSNLALADLPDLHCLPLLPESLEYIYWVGAGDCLPNKPSLLDYVEVGPDQFTPILPLLCTVLNSTCDFVNPAATGSVYWDQNANGVRDGGEPGYADATIHIQPGNILTGVNTMGDFNIGLPLDQYTLTATSGNPYVQSIVPASHDAPFVNTTDVDSGNDFGVVLQADVQDVRLDLDGPWGRPGLETWGGITYDNIGSTTVSGTIILQLDPMLTWVESTPPPTSVSGNTITWDYAGLQFGERRSIGFTVYTDPGVPLGTQLQHTATAGPVVSDETPADNTATSNTVVEGSWDPNDKRVEPATLTPADVAAGEELIYTIRFQNTGTYQADRVVVLDTLSADLQWNTMRLINSSHPCTWLLTGGGVLRFTFDPIFLPDSTSDEPNSHGFVRFAMKPVGDLMPGQSVANTAGIIFDFNAPVLTELAVFTVETSTGLAETGPEGPWAWPNPVEDVLFVRVAAGRTAEVRDLTGRLVLRERCGDGPHALDVRSLAAGSYLLRVSGAGSHVFIKR